MPGTPGPALQGCTLGWGAPGSLRRTLGSFPPLPHLRQLQHLGNTHRSTDHRSPPHPPPNSQVECQDMSVPLTRENAILAKETSKLSPFCLQGTATPDWKWTPRTPLSPKQDVPTPQRATSTEVECHRLSNRLAEAPVCQRGVPAQAVTARKPLAPRAFRVGSQKGSPSVWPQTCTHTTWRMASLYTIRKRYSGFLEATALLQGPGHTAW